MHLETTEWRGREIHKYRHDMLSLKLGTKTISLTGIGRRVVTEGKCGDGGR